MRQAINFDDLLKDRRKMVSIAGGGAGKPGGIESLTLSHPNFSGPGVPGIGALKKIKKNVGDVEVINVTRLETLAYAVKANQCRQESCLNQEIGGIS
jgi:hypothetical protein